MNSILRNECRRLRQRRDASALPLEEADGAADEGPSPLRLDIERALRRLPAEEARAIRLFYMAELPIPEIARRIGRPVGTIKSWLHRGRRHLAGQMEEYEPMARKAKTPTPAAAPQIATLLHTDLDAATVRRLTEALAAVGYEPRVLVPADLAALPEQLKETQFLVVDEWPSGRSTIELLIHLKSDPETEAVPVCVLCADPSGFTVSAFWGAGVDRLVDKKNAADMARLEDAFRFAYFSWRRFTERARWAFFRAQEAAAFLGSPAIVTEHLLLGLIAEGSGAAARVLAGLGVDAERARAKLQAGGLGATTPAGEQREGRAGTPWELFTTLDLGRPLPAPEEIATTVPLIAIRDKVYFPRTQFPLFIGREKSVRALKEAEAAGRLLLLVAQKELRTDDPQPDDLFTTGTVVRLLQMLPLPDGTVRVMVEGIARARIGEYLQTDEYLRVRVEVLPEEPGVTAPALVRRIHTEFRADLAAQIPHDHFDVLTTLEEPGRLADLLTPYLPLSIENQQAVLEMTSPRERLERILGYLTAVRNLKPYRAVLLGQPPPEQPEPQEEE
jgi:Lon protease-like protein